MLRDRGRVTEQSRDDGDLALLRRTPPRCPVAAAAAVAPGRRDVVGRDRPAVRRLSTPLRRVRRAVARPRPVYIAATDYSFSFKLQTISVRFGDMMFVRSYSRRRPAASLPDHVDKLCAEVKCLQFSMETLRRRTV